MKLALWSERVKKSNSFSHLEYIDSIGCIVFGCEAHCVLTCVSWKTYFYRFASLRHLRFNSTFWYLFFKVCRICGKAFINIYRLQRHMLTHSVGRFGEYWPLSIQPISLFSVLNKFMTRLSHFYLKQHCVLYTRVCTLNYCKVEICCRTKNTDNFTKIRNSWKKRLIHTAIDNIEAVTLNFNLNNSSLFQYFFQFEW